MVPEDSTQVNENPNSEPEIEPIQPAEAQEILEKALVPYLEDEWKVIDRGPFAARLTRDTRNLDVRIGVLGEVTTEESDLTPLQDTGRLVAWALLIAALMVALALSSALGIL